MAGLLDALQSDEGQMALGLLAAAGPSATPMSFGQRLYGAMQQDQARRSEAEDRKMRQQMQQLQMRALLEGEAARKKAAEQEQLDQNLLRQNFAPLPGPTPDGSPLMPNRLDPRFMLGQGASIGGLQQAMQLDQMLQPPKPKLTAYKPGDDVRDEQGRPVFSIPPAPEKPEATPTAIREYQFAVGQGFKGTFEQWDTARRQAGAPKAPVVNMYNTDSAKAETDLRKEFADIPQVKRFNAALPAYKAIEDAASRNNPQSDINLVYGIAKLYDPESVVREGEYGTIAGSQSIPEKIKGYAQYLAGGGRLTEQTKQQLLVEARGRINSFKTEHDAARKTYEGIATRRKLDPQNVFITPSDLPAIPTGATDLQSAAAAELARRRRNGSN
jgi:hypothetical protein